MSPSGYRARLLDYILIELDEHPAPRRYAQLRVLRWWLERSIPAYYPAPVTLHQPSARRAAA